MWDTVHLLIAPPNTSNAALEKLQERLTAAGISPQDVVVVSGEFQLITLPRRAMPSARERYHEKRAESQMALNEQEMTLVRAIRDRTGYLPDVKRITRDGTLVGVNITYHYVDPQGQEQQRTIAREEPEGEEMMLIALREAAQRANQDHHPRS